jgi:hypothetical protein
MRSPTSGAIARRGSFDCAQDRQIWGTRQGFPGPENPIKTGKNRQKQLNIGKIPTKSSEKCKKRGFYVDFAQPKAAL